MDVATATFNKAACQGSADVRVDIGRRRTGADLACGGFADRLL